MMTDTREQIQQQISDLFDSQHLAVLSTQQNSQPYSSLVAFSVSSNIASLYFLTPDTTRKYDNLTANPRVSFLITNSRNQPDDIYDAVSVTGTGIASVVQKDNDKNALDRYLAKHPHLKEFSRAPTTAFVRVAVNRYFWVSRFQNVIEYKVVP